MACNPLAFHLTCLENTVDRRIIQGQTREIVFIYPGDLSAYTFKAQIRRSHDDPDVLGEFVFSTPLYDAQSQKTTVIGTLTKDTSLAIPMPERVRASVNRTREGSNVWVWDCFAYYQTIGICVISESYVELIPNVTEED